MDIPLNEVVHFDVITSNPGTGAAVDADSPPTFAVYEENTDTDILVGAGTMTKRTALTGNYRGSFTANVGNGFEVGKWYSVVVSATVGGVVGKVVAKNFRVCAGEGVAGYPKVDTEYAGGTYWGSGAILDTTIAAGAITSAKFLAGAITASSLHSDAATEIAAAVWDKVRSAHTTPGTFGEFVKADVSYFGGTAGAFNAGRPEVNVSHVNGQAVNTASAQFGVNVVSCGSAHTGWNAGALAANTFATDAIGSAALAASAVTEIADAILRTALTEGYAADGATFTVEQFAHMVWSFLTQFSISAGVNTTKKLNGTTDAMTFQWNDATNPSTSTRTG